ncbi:hypothetical protein Y032_0072g697 [Ancylostoma ceylanicum]|uniref:Uncharacterized protein n=1 Tax=Ancylostoma ceylanicum TaxID=53326 RepID=A0A016TWZ6_9BILA|nr:hypothetical protein Y032_0072g697 [Ancylostoma ceylanicum]
MAVLNCSEPIPVPNISTVCDGLTSIQYIQLSAGGAISAAVIILGMLHISFIWKYVKDEKIRSKLYILALMFPTMVSLAIVSMVSPRTAPIYSSIGVLYILFCFYTITSLCRYVMPSAPPGISIVSA